MRLSHCTSICLLAFLLGCQAMHDPQPAANASAEAAALVPDYYEALEAHPHDYIAFMKAWFEGTPADIASPDIVRYVLAAGDRTADLGAEKLVAGHAAFCKENGGNIVKDPPALTCAGADDKAIARLSVQVFHASAEQPGTLQFTGESAHWMSRLNEERMADFRRVIDTVGSNGVSGNVLLASGDSFNVVRFGRLARPDFYALNTPNHGLVLFPDLVSVKWTEQGLSVVERDGDRYDDKGTGLTPHNTIVRLRPTADGQLKAEALTNEEPFRFVHVEAGSGQPRQVRVRGDAQIIAITISPKPTSYRSGAIRTRFDKKDRETFRKSLVAQARKTAANTGKKMDHLEMTDAKVHSDLEQIGRAGPCARTQSEDRLRSGDVSFSEYLVCAQYRQEAETVKANGGELSVDKTPLLMLGRAARAPWYDFNGILR